MESIVFKAWFTGLVMPADMTNLVAELSCLKSDSWVLDQCYRSYGKVPGFVIDKVCERVEIIKPLFINLGLTLPSNFFQSAIRNMNYEDFRGMNADMVKCLAFIQQVVTEFYDQKNNQSYTGRPPIVGEGATVITPRGAAFYSDRDAYEVVSVSADSKEVTIKRYRPHVTNPERPRKVDPEYAYMPDQLSDKSNVIVWRGNEWRSKHSKVDVWSGSESTVYGPPLIITFGVKDEYHSDKPFNW